MAVKNAEKLIAIEKKYNLIHKWDVLSSTGFVKTQACFDVDFSLNVVGRKVRSTEIEFAGFMGCPFYKIPPKELKKVQIGKKNLQKAVDKFYNFVRKLENKNKLSNNSLWRHVTR